MKQTLVRIVLVMLSLASAALFIFGQWYGFKVDKSPERFFRKLENGDLDWLVKNKELIEREDYQWRVFRDYSEYALSVAVTHGHYEIAELLISEGLDVNARDGLRFFPLTHR